MTFVKVEVGCEVLQVGVSLRHRKLPYPGMSVFRYMISCEQALRYTTCRSVYPTGFSYNL